jgi:hypothetical protein
MKRAPLLLCCALSAIPALSVAAAPDTEAVEFYNALTNHYFVTATASEARLIDVGATGPGWMRTGRSFQAWLAKSDAPADAQPVCRFYSSGANSHFYTASPGECQSLKDAEAAERGHGGVPRGWRYEGVAFYIQSPAGGACPAGTAGLLRVYNDGFVNGEGSNHRFIDDADLADLMVDSRWISEGTAFCAGTKSTGTSANLRPTTTNFAALSGTWKGTARFKLEAGGREDESAQPLELAFAADGAIAGKGYGCTFSGKVSTGDGFRSLFIGSLTASGCSKAAFDGEYSRIKLQRFGDDTLMVRMKRGDNRNEASIAARLTGDAATAPAQPTAPASFEAIAGDWLGTVGWEAQSGRSAVELNRSLSLAISAAGTVTGSGFGCTLTGTLTGPTAARAGFGGQVTAAGCENVVFNGAYAEVRVTPGRKSGIEVSFKRRDANAEAEIEGRLEAKDAGAPTPPPTPPAAQPLVTGTWEGMVSWSAGAVTGSENIRFTIGADGAFSGSGFGCTFSGTLKLALEGRAVASGSIAASGCTQAAFNGKFDDVAFTREDGDRLEIELEREARGAKVRVKGKVRRAG